MSHEIIRGMAFIERGDELLLAVKSASNNVTPRTYSWGLLRSNFADEAAAKGLMFQQRLSGNFVFDSSLARIRRHQADKLDPELAGALAEWDKSQSGRPAPKFTVGDAIDALEACASSGYYGAARLAHVEKAVLALRRAEPMPNPNEEVSLDAAAALYPIETSIRQRGLSDDAKASLISNPELAMEVGPMGITPLHTLARQHTFGEMALGVVQSGKLLIDCGANVNARNILGQTPLLDAVENGSVPLRFVENLLEAGADVNVSDRQGLTPLLLAATDSKRELFHLLIESGAKVDAVAADGRTPLHRLASGWGFSEGMAGALIDRGADVDARDDQGQSALHAAAGARGSEACAFLLARGANPALVDADGKSPLDIARARGEQGNVEILEAKAIERGLPASATAKRQSSASRGFSL